jgi:uncharacterized protein (TIGR03435 family)
MHELDDSVLLREYVEHGSDGAFATLVTRHINKIYSVALRHTRNAGSAEEITQAVFVILARKSRHLGKRVILSGWLYETARLTAMTHIRSEIRRVRREQEAYMQTSLNETDPDVWPQIAPLLDAAMAGLSETERQAIVLRFFDDKSMKEAGAALGASEDAVKMRVNRAVEKLRRFFSRRGIVIPAAALTAMISAHSVQAAPVTLAKAVTVTAVANGAAATTSTLVKGALKMMAWTKVKMAVLTTAVVLLGAGTMTLTVKEFHEHYHYPWQVPKASMNLIHQTPPQVVVVPTIFDRNGGYLGDHTTGGGAMGICQPITNIFREAYPGDTYRMIISPGLPDGRYDFFAKVSPDDPGMLWRKALQKELETKLGVMAKPEVRDSDVLLLEYVNPNAGGLQPPGSLLRRMNLSENFRSIYGTNSMAHFVSPISDLKDSLQAALQIPVVDETGLKGLYDFKLTWDNSDQTKIRENVRQAALDQLGFKLVPTNMPVEMLVVEQTK